MGFSAVAVDIDGLILSDVVVAVVISIGVDVFCFVISMAVIKDWDGNWSILLVGVVIFVSISFGMYVGKIVLSSVDIVSSRVAVGMIVRISRLEEVLVDIIAVWAVLWVSLLWDTIFERKTSMHILNRSVQYWLVVELEEAILLVHWVESQKQSAENGIQKIQTTIKLWSMIIPAQY